MVEAYADIIDKEMDSKAEKVAASYIKYISKKYEKAIKSSLKKDKECREVGFRILGRKVDNRILEKVREIVFGHFKNLGFKVSLHHTSSSCKCLFNKLCNCDEVTISW
jgi:hypothetical protein